MSKLSVSAGRLAWRHAVLLVQVVAGVLLAAAILAFLAIRTARVARAAFDPVVSCSAEGGRVTLKASAITGRATLTSGALVIRGHGEVAGRVVLFTGESGEHRLAASLGDGD